MPHDLFCGCAPCKLLWTRQEAYDTANPIEGDEETINFEDEKELDRVMDFPHKD